MVLRSYYPQVSSMGRTCRFWSKKTQPIRGGGGVCVGGVESGDQDKTQPEKRTPDQTIGRPQRRQAKKRGITEVDEMGRGDTTPHGERSSKWPTFA